MKKISSAVWLTILLGFISIAIYSFQILRFESPRDTAFYFLQDMAFLPLQVALVTVVLGKILNDREKRERLKKTNMIVGAFFSEIGNRLVIQLDKTHTVPEDLRQQLHISESWSAADFENAAGAIRKFGLSISCTSDDLQELKDLLSEKRSQLLRLIENPNLLEHETFTDMLWSVFHLTDELLARDSVSGLPKNDMTHLNNDADRAFRAVLSQWVSYMAHLKSEYPYLFSLELRKSPYGGGKIIVG